MGLRRNARPAGTIVLMQHNISKDELRLLAYLHEHATGFDKRHGLKAAEVVRALEFSDDELRKHASYLAGLGLIDMRRFTMLIGPPDYELKGIWITIKGENLMRELESAPGIARKITSKAASAIFDMSREIVVNVVSEFMSRWVGA